VKAAGVAWVRWRHWLSAWLGEAARHGGGLQLRWRKRPGRV